jgi:uncharacterized protein
MPRPRASKGRARQSVKMVVTGPFAAGKTTLIQTISEITVLSTERRVSDRTASVKGDTTVAMDFGRLSIDDELALYLFGTPGQKRFDFMWEILSEGMLGFVVIVDAGDPGSFDEAAGILSFFRDRADVPYVVAANKTGEDDSGSVERVRRLLHVPEDVRVVPCDARDRASVKEVLLALFYAVLDDVDAAVPTSA